MSAKKASRRRATKPAKKPTADDLLRLKKAEQRAAEAYSNAVYDLSPNLTLARRLLDQAAKLSIALRQIVAPGPDDGGLWLGTRTVGEVARLLELEAKSIEREVLRGEVAS